MAEVKPTIKTYDGPSGAGRDSEWLAAEDLPEARDVVVTIEDVRLCQNVTFEAGRVKERGIALKFAGRDRLLLLNSTNRKTLNALFGTLTKSWRGRRIALWVKGDVKLKNETVRGIRIRDTEPPAPTAPSAGGASQSS